MDIGIDTPPGSPTEGDSYVIGATPTGLWAGHANKVTIYFDSVWRFFTPKEGWLVYSRQDENYFKYTGTSWVVTLTSAGASWGWQDWSHSGSSQAITLANTFYPLINNGLGPLTNTTYKVPSHGNIWNTATNRLDFSDLSVGDEVTIRVDLNVTTASSNHEITLNAVFDIGGSSYALRILQESFKNAGTHNIVATIPFYIGSTSMRDNPAEIRIASDTTGDSVVVNGWYIKTLVR